MRDARRRRELVPLEVTPPDETTATPERRAVDEGPGLGRAVAEAYARAVRFQRQRLGRAPEEALTEAREPPPWEPDDLADAPAGYVSWLGLGRLMEEDPDAGEALWARITAEARAELDSGHRAAGALEWEALPYQRAEFLAVRQAFRDEWRPQGGLEDALLDVLAQAHHQYLAWTHVLVARGAVPARKADETLARFGHREAPRLEEAAELEQAARMADRFNRLFHRTLRSLRDLRRYGPVVVHNPAQVNIGHQQVNAIQGPAPDTAAAALPPGGPGDAGVAPRGRRRGRGGRDGGG
jgi:hypothetical protein